MGKAKLILLFLLISFSSFAQHQSVEYFQKDVWFKDTVHYKNSADTANIFLYNHKIYVTGKTSAVDSILFVKQGTNTPLKTNLAGSGGGSSPGGPYNSIQFNKGGVLGGSARFIIDTVTNSVYWDSFGGADQGFKLSPAHSFFGNEANGNAISFDSSANQCDLLSGTINIQSGNAINIYGNPFNVVDGPMNISCQLYQSQTSEFGNNFYVNDGISGNAAGYVTPANYGFGWGDIGGAVNGTKIIGDDEGGQTITYDAIGGHFFTGFVSNTNNAQSGSTFGCYATHASFDNTINFMSATRASSSAFRFFECYSSGFGLRSFYIRGDGLAFSQDYEMYKGVYNSATLNFGSIAGQASDTLGFAVTGAAVGDAVIVGPGTFNLNMVYTGYVRVANWVTIEATNNNTLTAIDPASATFKAKVIK